MAADTYAYSAFGGHSTVLIEMSGTRLVTDPLLRRRIGPFRHRPAFGKEELDSVDAVLLSHLHHDHCDLASLRMLGEAKPIIGPPGATVFLGKHGFENVTELAPGETHRVGGVEVRSVDAHHVGGRIFKRGPGDTVGFVLEAEARVYFAGDTDLFDGMAELAPSLDVALLPIWGWGPILGEGHLDPESAAEAARLLRPRVAVPIHWGALSTPGSKYIWPWLFHGPPQRFAEAMARTAPDVEVRVLEPGERMSLLPD
jgi:L-ascorbate metabolism protein UlaG (beta-lactamase superfamily)